MPGWLRWLPVGWGRYWVIQLADDCRYADSHEYARPEGDSVRVGISAFAVPADLPGIRYGKKEDKMGWNSQPTRAIFFDDVRVPQRNRAWTPPPWDGACGGWKPGWAFGFSIARRAA